MRPFEGREMTARLRSLDVEIPLAEIYAGIVFGPPPEAAAAPG